MEDLTAVPMSPGDREQLLVLLRCPEDADMTWVQTMLARYDIARSIQAGLLERPARVAFMCNPDESGGVESDPYDLDDPKSEGWHSRHADLWDNRDKTLR